MTEVQDRLDPERAWTRRSALREGVRMLEAAGIEDTRRNVEWMLSDVTGCSRALLYAHSEQALDSAQIHLLNQMLARRMRREPLQYILGETVFFGLTIRVTPDVLIPRPETEQVVAHALRLIETLDKPRVLDIGAGSGCIALAIKRQRTDAEVIACDVSEAALAVAANAEAHDAVLYLLHADALAPDFPDRIPDALDLVISNPPYIPLREKPELAAEVRDYEPELALFAGQDAMTFYRAIAQHATRLLRPGGWLVFETHADFGAQVRDHLTVSGFAGALLLPDLSGRPRIVSARRPGPRLPRQV